MAKFHYLAICVVLVVLCAIVASASRDFDDYDEFEADGMGEKDECEAKCRDMEGVRKSCYKNPKTGELKELL